MSSGSSSQPNFIIYLNFYFKWCEALFLFLALGEQWWKIQTKTDIYGTKSKIPNLRNINNLNNHNYTVFRQKNLSFKLNLINKTLPNWFGSRICKKKYLKNPQWLRDQKVKKFSFFKFFRIKWNIIEDGGWHFSYLMNPEQIQEKLRSFAHSEFNNSFYTDLNRINDAINNKKDLFGRDQLYEKIKIDNSFPDYISENKSKFSSWIV